MATNDSTSNMDTTLETVFSFADFSALLTLFGDEATKQFLATSISGLDTVLLGIAPLGIMTIIVSAIRVGGSPLMKSVIGRARDSPDDEEKEILSSTSSNVREIWDGNRVVRQTGESKTIPLVYNPKDKSLVALCVNRGSGMVPFKFLKDPGLPWGILSSAFLKRNNRRRPEYERLSQNISPNLTLNTPTGIPSRRTVNFLVITGLLIQAAVFVVNAFAVYRWQWVKSGKPIERYAYPLWVAGTGAITIGVWLCGWVVESSSEKMVMMPNDPEELDEYEPRIIFMQQEIPAQNIPAYAIESIPIGKKMIYSRRLWSSTPGHDSSSQVDVNRRAREYRLRVTCVSIGTLLTLLGFVAQNIGTRGLHWSAGLLQLGATAALTILRALIRRNVGRLADDGSTNTIQKLESGFEACQLSTKLLEHKVYLASALVMVRKPTGGSKNKYSWTFLDIDENEILFGEYYGGDPETTIENVLEAQMLLTRYVPEVKRVETAAANCLKAMEEILNLLILPGQEEHAWSTLGAFLCVAVNHLGKAAAPSTAKPKFRLIKAPSRRDKRLQLLQAVISCTHYHNRGFQRWSDPVVWILGHCAQDDVEASRRLLGAWVEPYRSQGNDSGIIQSQSLRPAETEDNELNKPWQKRGVLFGLSLSHGLRNAICKNQRPQKQQKDADSVHLLWRDRRHAFSVSDDFLVLQIGLDIISSFILMLASRKQFRSGFARHRANKDELCKSLEDIIERNGFCQQGTNARLAFVPALVSCGILDDLPGDPAAKSSVMPRQKVKATT